jgi:arsenate reductase
MSDRTINVLFLCTGNSARSIMAEAILNAVGGGRFRAYSAGSHPNGKVNPFALAQIRKAGLSTKGYRSKSWDEFAQPDAPKIDFVFTVCSDAAGEVCPIWPGHPMTAHWGVEDPAAFQGTDNQMARFFATIYTQLYSRIRILTSLPLDKLDRVATQQKLHEIGKT